MEMSLNYMYKFFFNWLYKIKPPESVQYWKYGDSARAKVGHGKDGALQMEIENEKYAYPGFPRGPVLTGPLAKLKHKVKNVVFNKAFAELEVMAKDMKYDMLPREKMSKSVRELDRVFEKLENAEVVEDMKKRIQLIRRVMTFFLQEDDAYRMRWQWCMERLNMKEIKLTKADKYYFRGKYLKVDHHKYDY